MASAGIGWRWLPVWLPKLAIFGLFMTLSREITRIALGLERRGTPRPSAALRRLRANITAAPGDGEDEALRTQDVDGTEHGISTDAILLLDLLHGRQRTSVPLTFGDLCPQDA
jgi:hypothetical protein